MFTSTDSCHLSPAEMVLSTQGQKTFPLKFYLGSIIATPEEKLLFLACHTRYCVTKTQDYRIKNHVGANI